MTATGTRATRPTSAGTLPSLHVPDEPVARKERWLAEVLNGAELGEVLSGPEGVTAWLYSRWRVLAGAGVGEDQLASVVAGYRREVWLWLAGERTWAQCCSGLLGRLGRRVSG